MAIASSTRVTSILDKALAGARISPDEGLTLLEQGDLPSLGLVAGELTRRKHPDGIVTFVIDRNINYTNVCVTDCKFCAFYRHEKDQDAYVLSHEEILEKVRELDEIGGTQLLIQGGHHPKLKFDYYLEMCRLIKQRFPHMIIHSFSAPELIHFSRVFKLPVRQVIRELRAVGWESLPGAGAEILADRPRQIIAPLKITGQQWLEVMEMAAEEGAKATATMMFGHVETLAERIEHLEKLRDLQDRTNVFRAFICWTFQSAHTPMERMGMLRDWRPTTSHEYLRTLAVSRIYLDNFDNIQASWVTQGPKVGQISLDAGCNDFGGTMMEENVVSAAGTTFRMSPEEAVRLIKLAGRRPAKRNTRYEILEIYD